jgi:hypothetical protein
MKEIYIRFMAPVIPVTIDHLMKIVDKRIVVTRHGETITNRIP